MEQSIGKTVRLRPTTETEKNFSINVKLAWEEERSGEWHLFVYNEERILPPNTSKKELTKLLGDAEELNIGRSQTITYDVSEARNAAVVNFLKTHPHISVLDAATKRQINPNFRFGKLELEDESMAGRNRNNFRTLTASQWEMINDQEDSSAIWMAYAFGIDTKGLEVEDIKAKLGDLSEQDPEAFGQKLGDPDQLEREAFFNRAMKLGVISLTNGVYVYKNVGLGITPEAAIYELYNKPDLAPTKNAIHGELLRLTGTTEKDFRIDIPRKEAVVQTTLPQKAADKFVKK